MINKLMSCSDLLICYEAKVRDFVDYNAWTQEQRDFVAAHGADCEAFEEEFGMYRTPGALQGKMASREHLSANMCTQLFEDIYDV